MNQILLIKCAIENDRFDHLSQLARDLPAASFWRAKDAPLVYAYAETGLSPPVVAGHPEWMQVQLECEADLAGASIGCDAPCHYVVETDVVPEAASDLEAWYREEHLPGLAAVPGAVRARRFIDPVGTPRYYACYDIVSFEVLTSDAWLAVRATAWSSRIRPMFCNTRRTLFRRF